MGLKGMSLYPCEYGAGPISCELHVSCDRLCDLDSPFRSYTLCQKVML